MGGKYAAYPEYKDSGLAWLGEMPSQWRLRKSKYLFNRMQRSVRPEDGVVTAFRDGQVTLRSKRRTDGFTQSVKEIGYQSVRVGDLLVHAMDGFAGAIGVSDSDGKCSPVCSVCVPMNPDQMYMPYYGYLVRQLAVTDFISSLAKGIRERSTEFRYSEFSALDLAVPSLDEQQKIANFLDHEAAKIDTLIEKQQQLIKLLKEKRQAVISHAVTKGLNPNAPMRDSGVEWLGAVPEGWELPKLIHRTSRIGDGLHSTPKYQDSTGYYFVNGNNLVNGNILVGATAKEVPEEEYKNHYIGLNESSVLLSINGTIGNVARYNGENIILGKSAAYMNCSGDLLPEYLMLYLQSSQALRYFDLEVTGTTIYNLSLTSIRQMKVCIPINAEQLKIVGYCQLQKNKYDALIEKASSAITLMQERRTALISAAVTGKIDVRSWQAPEPSTTTNNKNKEVAV